MTKSPLNRLQRHWPSAPGRQPDREQSESAPWTATLRPWVARVEEIIGERPAASLAAAAAVGVLLGMLIKRR